jgi:hypothetical protein
VQSENGKELGWTRKSNIAQFLKNNSEMQTVTLIPSKQVSLAGDDSKDKEKKILANTYNRIGGLIEKISNKFEIGVPEVLAVWRVESAGKEHIPEKAIIRFENHRLYKYWGKYNEMKYKVHFQHGGHNDVDGKSWTNHSYRLDKKDDFCICHTSQDSEYEVLKLASKLAGEEIACKCLSIGGCQIMVDEFLTVGYSNASAMYKAFQKNERNHVLGFFDFCQYKLGFGNKAGQLLKYLKEHNWNEFARYYNGDQTGSYGGQIKDAFQKATKIL